mmetsp:Transcript_18990/g.24451  ORF Transcript_18990/g.24451 Transcript_18990/m.24451 type:complete len:256 (-) Transcript_18990:456-1223(-)|eukprot:CAMPEP_0198145634 /NCGR_PEP_ID=MMETSP1443-20131203/24754_1 /TAXON_ID=186043 /ORGANISM="Entomoneis sp., Strain CCMP2396" /LENGTH=255 /DNA_ID=CAMNT_0043809333 /DNA_START=124 /DNA_END=891 /DNA_ORIENTATION=-
MSESESDAGIEDSFSELAIVAVDEPKKKKKDKKEKKEKKDKKEKKPKKDTPVDDGAKPNAPPPPDPKKYEMPFKAWMHPPKKHKVEGTSVTVKVPEKTDCWRKTRHNFIMDNAPFYWHKVNGDFEVVVHVKGDFSKIYDKAGIMIRVDPENWMVTALEYFNEGLNHSTCITHDYTDWSLCPLGEKAGTDGVWLCAKKIGNTYETFHSVNGRTWIQARQGLFHDDESVRVGIFCACPMGTSFSVTYDQYRCTPIHK